MREIFEIRLPEHLAQEHFSPDVGEVLGDFYQVRKIEAPIGSPLFHRLVAIDQDLRARGGMLITGWRLHRRYTKREMNDAELFNLVVTAWSEQDGEEHGTVYADSNICRISGSRRERAGELVLDIRKLPRRDVVCTLEQEWVVSARAAWLMVDAGITGIELRPVQHHAHYRDDSLDPSQLPAGRELLKQAETQGLDRDDWRFWVWLSQPPQSWLVEQMRQEHSERMQRKEAVRTRSPKWFELKITSWPISIIAPTRLGTGPQYRDQGSTLVGDECGVIGPEILSELYVERADWDGSDFAVSRQLVRTGAGGQVATPLIITSPRVRELFVLNSLSGFRFEVVHLAAG